MPEISLEQIRQQLYLSVDRVMSGGSLYDPHLAALAVKQARGDLMEAIFLLRAEHFPARALRNLRPRHAAPVRARRRSSDRPCPNRADSRILDAAR